MIKVLIVDDQDLMLQGLSMLVGREEGLEVVGSCYNGQEAVEFCLNSDVDVVLMDIRMPVLNGVEATKQIIEAKPTVKIIILTTFSDDEYIFSSLRNGASGYLLKDAKPVEITTAIEKVYNGGTLINPDIAAKLVHVIREGGSFNKEEVVYYDDSDKEQHNGDKDQHNGDKDQHNGDKDFRETDIDYQDTKLVDMLTNREKDICHLLAEGKNNKEIGERLMISDGTVKNNITRILDKLSMRDRTQLALFALRCKL